jgi:hypothetical protein
VRARHAFFMIYYLQLRVAIVTLNCFFRPVGT